MENKVSNTYLIIFIISIFLFAGSLYFINISTNYLNILAYSPVPLGFQIFYYALFYICLISAILSGVLFIKTKKKTLNRH